MTIRITQAALNLGTAVALGDSVVEQIVGRLSLEPSVTAARWRVEPSIE